MSDEPYVRAREIKKALHINVYEVERLARVGELAHEVRLVGRQRVLFFRLSEAIPAIRAMRDARMGRVAALVGDEPLAEEDAPNPHGRAGFPSCVYFIQENMTGLIKIGITSSVTSRLNTLRVGMPFKLTLLGTIDGGKTVERAVHRQFSALRVTGEWFRPNADLIEFIRGNVSSSEGVLR